LPWKAVGGYLAIAAIGLLLVIRLPAPGGGASASAPAPGSASVPAAAFANHVPPAASGARPGLGDLLAWLATGSTDGPFALLRAVLPGFGLGGATGASPVESAPPTLPDPPAPDNLHSSVHRPVPADAPAPTPVMAYGVRPRVLLYETDPTAVGVASELASDLFSGYGVPVLLLRTPFGGIDPYLAAQAGIEAAMKAHPSIQVLLDIHADQPAAGEPLTAMVGGAPAARVMIVVGDSQTLPEPNWRENAAWAVQLAGALAHAYPGLLRTHQGYAFYSDGGRFDQQLSPAALLLAIGGPGVPAAAELRGADLLAEVLGPMIHAGSYPGFSP
jgi:stage II sporulation protein P